MPHLFAATLSGILTDVVLGFAAFFTGFAAALSYCRWKAATVPAAPEPEPAPQAAPSSVENDTARAHMAAQQLRDLAQNVASDVGAHNTLVGNISIQLDALKDGDAGNSHLVREAVEKMLNANKKLQTRLEEAETKIQTQAEEIRTQQSEARTDALTKLANRRAFDTAIEENLEALATNGRPFSLVLFDVDHFKLFNDTYGHLAGDEVLRCVAKTVKRTVKVGDLACRYGGEEFAVIMAGATAADAEVAGERIRMAIEGMTVDFGGKTLRVTASMGMAECQPEEIAAALIRRADSCVYASKKGGRNCSHIHNGVDCVPVVVKSAPKTVEVPPQPKLTLQQTAPVALADRTVFSDELRRRISESHRSGEPVSVLHLRVKDYRKLEHMYGNAVGALLLESLAAFISSTLRDMDMMARLEVGEFVVLLPGSTAVAAKIVGQRVKTSISHCPVSLASQQIRLDLDLGVASVHHGDDAAATMARAKQSMEAAAAAEAAAKLAAGAEPLSAI